MISIIIPCYNESGILPEFIKTLEDKISEINDKFEIIFVDNNSSDETIKIIQEKLNKSNKYKIIKLSNYFGKESAILSGLDNCQGESAIIMDPDLEDPPELIDQLINKMKDGYDVVLTVRQSETLPLYKKILKFIFYKILVFSSQKHNQIYANSGDFRILNRKVIDHLKSMRERTRFLRGLVNYVGFKQTYISFQRPFRKKGNSKSSFNFLIKYGFDSLFSFSNVPISLITKFGFVLFVLIVLFGIFLLLQKIFGNPIEGFTTVLLFIGLISSFNILAIGLVGEYVSRIYNEVKNRPNYIIEKIIDNS